LEALFNGQQAGLAWGRGEIADCETGTPPVGWESEGQFRIADFAMSRRQRTEDRRHRDQEAPLRQASRDPSTSSGQARAGQAGQVAHF